MKLLFYSQQKYVKFLFTVLFKVPLYMPLHKIVIIVYLPFHSNLKSNHGKTNIITRMLPSL